MKEEKKIMIVSVLKQLVERDPVWAQVNMQLKFKALYDGWRQKELRAKIHSGFFYSKAWQRGWLPQADFVRFRDYVME